MARKPLRSQLNQIRAWVREGRTDAWIAHQLEVPATELSEFRRRHELAPEDDGGEVDLRDEIEAEIEAAMEEEDEVEEEAEEPATQEEKPAEGRGRRRRRGGRGRGRGKKAGGPLQGTFDHGDADGFGLWLDPAVQDDPVYSENWAGHREVEVTIEAEQIVIKRV